MVTYVGGVLPDGNPDLYKGIKGTRNGNLCGWSFFLLFKFHLKIGNSFKQRQK